MNPTKKKILIGVGILAVASLSLLIFVKIKKRNNAGWFLLKPKQGRKIIINRA